MDEAREAIAVATTTLATKLNCSRSEINVAEVRPVTWPNSALGCPEPGKLYLQVLTPGYQIRLVHAGRDYLVHTDRGTHAVYCPDGGMIGDVDSSTG